MSLVRDARDEDLTEAEAQYQALDERLLCTFILL